MRIQLGDREVGDGCPVFCVAELGVNCNGSVDIGKRLIDAAAQAGADAVKLQKRTVSCVYARAPFPEGYLDMPREHPFGGAQTQRGQKEALEFDRSEWEALAMHAREQGVQVTASCWDEQALADVIEWIDPSWIKVASPCVLDGPLMRAHGATGLPLVISTGGLGSAEIERVLMAVYVGACQRQAEHTRRVEAEAGSTCDVHIIPHAAPLALLHCCSSYPSEDGDLNLFAIPAMYEEHGRPIGFSSHARGIATTSAAVALGACVIEAHLTLDRTMYGSDQAASLEPGAFKRMVRDIRAVESALGDGVKRAMPSEEAALNKLRRVID